MYKLIVLMGKAGSGKDTILREVVKQNPDIHEVVSCTTRPPREGEVDGVNYHFLTGEEFGAKVLKNEMLEATCFNEWFYGTSFDSLDKDKVNIGVFNPTGVESLREYKDIHVLTIWVEATDKNRLLRQLNREKEPDVNEIIRRFKADEMDFSDIDFDYVKLNNNDKDDLEVNTNAVLAFVQQLKDELY